MNTDYLFNGQFPPMYYILMITTFIVIAYTVSHYLYKTNKICDMYSTELCDHYYSKYKEKCRYKTSHNVFCIREVIKNGI